MGKTIYQRKGNFKGLLFVFGLLIIAAILVYTQHLVNLLQEKSREYLRFRVKIFEENINNPNADTNYEFFFNEVIQGTDYPIIYTDPEMVPRACKNISEKIDTLRVFPPDATKILNKYLSEMDSDNTPIPITYQGAVLGYYHYGVSPVIKKLRWLPYVEISAAILFILIGYVGFSQIKKSEQRYIWVGMAKETAHQLGTPLSSISGWLEILKEQPEQLEKAIKEVGIDSKRLAKVASRFSQIGSVPSLKMTNVVKISKNAVAYFRKRLPRFDKKITIKENYNFNANVKLNGDLFEWVLENLIKNAIDAIGSKEGLINIEINKSDKKNLVNIDITDDGRGINSRDRHNIFKPGFSTKARGWGLGLSLAKRIVEDYHGGKLFIKDTRIGNGTTIRITLKTN
jgi:hypothetical protein